MPLTKCANPAPTYNFSVTLLAIEGGEPVRRNPLIPRPHIPEDGIEMVLEVLRSGLLSYGVGRFGKELEFELARFVGVRHAVATSSGTSALHVALKALGVGPGDEVVTTPFTFVATASAILHANAVPVFADIDRETLNLDAASLERVVGERTKAIIVVHLAGMPVELDEIRNVAEQAGASIVEDAAQALGAEYRGVRVGALGDVAAFSFYATKHVVAGEGGAITTNRDDVAALASLIRSHGEARKYWYEVLGYNYRIDEMSAAIALSQLRKIGEELRKRERFAKTLIEELEPLIGDVVAHIPRPRPYMRHSWHLVQVLLNIERLGKPRDFVVEAIRAEGFYNVFVAYPVPLHRTPLFEREIGHGKGCPWRCPLYTGKRPVVDLGNAEWAAERVVSVLVTGTMSEEDAVDVAKAFKKVLNAVRR